MNLQPILILGGGINGAALARELVLNGQNVWLVDTADLAFGATAYSSRLIHGGLRYLEFGDVALVRESLTERQRLLELAPTWVHPLRLFIPVRNRWGGLLAAGAKFLGLPALARHSPRGKFVVGIGLAWYDQLAGQGLPPRSLHRPGEAGVPAVDPRAARWLWAYSDAQITYPERFVIALLTDARRLAEESGRELRVFTYCQAHLVGERVEIQPRDGGQPSESLQPAAIVNATGAWVDRTLARLPVPSPLLMGGTKGSHFWTLHRPLVESLAGRGVYAEARDGRPVFVLPLGEGALVGTTDLPYSGDPAEAVASEEELAYLLELVEELFPHAGLARHHIAMHQCGVRPLPRVDARTPAAITRRHQLVWNEASPVPLVSLVGGKLTTCRSLAEEAAAAVLGRLGQPVRANSRQRPLLPTAIDRAIGAPGQPPQAPLADLARQAIREEWATRLEDLVERRLMLHFASELQAATLAALADVLVEEGRLPAEEAPTAVERCLRRLRAHFGMANLTLPSTAPSGQ
jgi:glycerol-3-phosphate dehydrogenase